ncbi:hypothetical protein SISSUDRAFT_205746 [Sistotremastrum suecicum HHB10207 ss-3]|uniref:Uncharacterized protein n=1 Tax=Sistotremastrum suecicum HHB10207 ss-3 TaxID=1314776 RepID=A0A166GME5_9AGAM|nr:hypothetical protein SISSUDRAFT_205746 [Sistotremastrum suecicum HHB10207 ss-3]
MTIDPISTIVYISCYRNCPAWLRSTRQILASSPSSSILCSDGIYRKFWDPNHPFHLRFLLRCISFLIIDIASVLTIFQDAPDQKPQGLVDYTLWEEKRDLGHRVLQILKGEDLQRRALGPEGYAFVTSVLGVPDVPQPLANDAEKSTAGLAKQPPPQKKIIGPQSRVSQAHARDPLKPSQENHEGQHSVASFGPASKKRPLPRIRNKESSVATATEEPIRKRKKSRPSAESTVIDLTLSP